MNNDRYYVPEIHQIKLNGKNILLDVNTSRVFEVDDLVYDILKTAPGKNKSKLVSALARKHPKEEIQAALQEMDKLKLIAKEPLPVPRLRVKSVAEHPIRHMDMIISQDCNMRCRYCFASTGSYKANRTLMPLEVVQKSIQFLVHRSKDETNLHVTFFGGEPLMNLPGIKRTIEFGEKKAKEASKRISFSISTNATLLTKEVIEYLHQKNVNIQVSIDGDEETQNLNRPYRGNLPTYRDICENVANLMHITKKRIAARTTVTSSGIHKLVPNVQHLLSLGFHSVHIEIATGKKGKIFIRSDQQIDELKKQFRSLADIFLSKIQKSEHMGVHNFIRVLRSINVNSRKIHPCGAGRGYVCVGVNGDIFPCHRFVGNNKYLMGNAISDSYDPHWEKIITDDIAMTNRETCKACWARFLCGGDCIAVSEEYHGDIRIPDSSKCELIKYITELGMMIYAHIPRNRKKQIEELYDLPKLDPSRVNNGRQGSESS